MATHRFITDVSKLNPAQKAYLNQKNSGKRVDSKITSKVPATKSTAVSAAAVVPSKIPPSASAQKANFLNLKSQQELVAGRIGTFRILQTASPLPVPTASAGAAVSATPLSGKSVSKTPSSATDISKTRLSITQVRGMTQGVTIAATDGGTVAPPASSEASVVACIASHRFGYGPKPSEFSDIQRAGGARQWLLSQLNVNTRDFARSFRTSVEQIAEFYRLLWRSGDVRNAFQMTAPTRAEQLLMLREAVLTSKPFLMHWARFMMNRTNVSFKLDQVDPSRFETVGDLEIAIMANSYFAEAIVPNCLGKMEDFIKATAWHPAMLAYLDGQRNHRSNPNQNYAREVMELHTVGVDAGYTQADVEGLARLFTGMRYSMDQNSIDPPAGVVWFADPIGYHDRSPRTVPFLGWNNRAPAPGYRADIDEALTLLARHPATGLRLAKQMVNYFITDNMQSQLATEMVQMLSNTFNQTQGDLGAMVRAMINHPAALAITPDHNKYKQPEAYVIGVMRASRLITPQNAPGEDAFLVDMLQDMEDMQQTFWAAPDVRGWLSPNSNWLNGRIMAARLDRALMKAPAISSRVTPETFFRSTIGPLVLSSQSRYSNIITQDYNRGILPYAEVLMSREFMMMGA